MAANQAKLLLQKQLAELGKHPVEGFSAGLIDDNDIFKWEVSRNSLSLPLITNYSIFSSPTTIQCQINVPYVCKITLKVGGWFCMGMQLKTSRKFRGYVY